MPQVTVLINGHEYDVACGKGQERRTCELADYVDSKIKQLVGQLGNREHAAPAVGVCPGRQTGRDGQREEQEQGGATSFRDPGKGHRLLSLVQKRI